MDGTFFCSRCGLGGLAAAQGRVACGRCGHVFAVPGRPSVSAQPLVPEQIAPAVSVAPATVAPRTVGYDIATALMLYLFVPVGLALLWAHPTWPHRRKVLLTGVVVGLWTLILTVGMVMALMVR